MQSPRQHVEHPCPDPAARSRMVSLGGVERGLNLIGECRHDEGEKQPDYGEHGEVVQEQADRPRDSPRGKTVDAGTHRRCGS